ncbi:hypothetical protein [Streptomyces sp. NRRL S-241]|uniref:hypothetical protein n=1 Tax=Streptomyces sp. NRRL S-241 TaxID=1463896 RepID=UPI0004C2263C|nr:hypothetical protein [Streptomyces sp. NRRL S-241]
MAQPTRTITGTYTNPTTQQPATGRIVLATLPAVWTDTDGGEILAGGGTFEVVDGALSRPLVVTDAPGVEPATGRYWVYEERLVGMPYRRRVFELPEGDGSPIKISTIIAADPEQAGYTPVEGPPGPPGDAGPQPPLGAAGAGANIALRSTDPTTTNARTPTAHAASHGSGGTDPVAPAAIGAETPAAAQTKANAAQAAAEATAAGALAAHAADTTDVHGITDTSSLETSAGAAGKVSAHAAASDPHGDRAWATGQFYPLASGNALNGFLDDALLRIADLETRVTNAEAETRTAVKTADEPITNNTLQDDDHLALSVVANGWYEVAMYLDVEGDPAADISMGWTVPAGAALSWTENGVSAGNTNNIGSIKLQRNDAATASGVGIIAAGSAVLPRGVLRVAGTGGTLQFRWAQTSTNASPTILKAGSMLKLTRIA